MTNWEEPYTVTVPGTLRSLGRQSCLAIVWDRDGPKLIAVKGGRAKW